MPDRGRPSWASWCCGHRREAKNRHCRLCIALPWGLPWSPPPTACVWCCRALALNAEGTLLLSGSSDHTLRLWDLGQQRCLHTFAVHTDSVWALSVDSNFGVAYSGGRDKCVYRYYAALLVGGERTAAAGRQAGSSPKSFSLFGMAKASSTSCLFHRVRCVNALIGTAAAACTPASVQALHLACVWPHLARPAPPALCRTQLASRTSELLLTESQPVRKLAVSSGGDSVWVATSSSTLHRWELDPHMGAAATPRGPVAQGRAFVAPPTAVLRARMVFEGGEARAAWGGSCSWLTGGGGSKDRPMCPCMRGCCRCGRW